MLFRTQKLKLRKKMVVKEDFADFEIYMCTQIYSLFVVRYKIFELVSKHRII